MTALNIRYGAPIAVPLDVLLSAIPSLPRRELGRLVERAIDHMDRLDGDPDVEDDDPAGDPLELYGEHSSDTGCAMLPGKPLYDEDQTLGPINERDAARAYQRQQPES